MSTPTPPDDHRELARLVHRYLAVSLHGDYYKAEVEEQRVMIERLEAFIDLGIKESNLAYVLPALRDQVNDLCARRDAMRLAFCPPALGEEERAAFARRQAVLAMMRRRCTEAEQRTNARREEYSSLLDELHRLTAVVRGLDLRGCASGTETQKLRAKELELHDVLGLMRNVRHMSMLEDVHWAAAHVGAPRSAPE